MANTVYPDQTALSLIWVYTVCSEIYKHNGDNITGERQNKNMTREPREDSDQPGHSLSLNRAFPVGFIGSLGPKPFFRRTATTLARLDGYPVSSESSLREQVNLFVLSCSGSAIVEMLTNIMMYDKFRTNRIVKVLFYVVFLYF